MFCGNCGTKSEDGALFCPNCGARLGAPGAVQEPIQQVTEQVAAPVQEAAQPVYGQVAAPVQEAVQPVYEQVAAPVQEAAQPVYEQVAAPVQEAAQPVYEQFAAPVQEAAQPVYEQVAAPVQEAVQPTFEQAAAPVQAAAQQFPSPDQIAAPMPAPDFPANPMPEAAPAAPVKKKGKAGLIIGVSAAAVVVGGAAIGYFGFHDKITRMFMGDAKYATMITKEALKPSDNSEENAKYVNSFISVAADSAMSSMAKSKASSSPDGSTGGASVNRAVYSALTNNLFPSFNYNKVLNDIFSELPENSTVTTTMNMTVEPGSKLSKLTEGTVGEIIKKLNDLKFGSSLSNGSTDRVAFTLGDSNGAIATAEAYFEESGDIIIALPGMTESTVRIKKEDIDKFLGKDGEQTESEPEKTFDVKEADRIRKEIVKILYDSFEKADIKYTDNITYSLGSGEYAQSAKGTETSITFTSEQLDEAMNNVFTFLQNDEYVLSYAKDKFSLTADDCKELFKSGTKAGVTLTMSYIVDVHNNVLASRYTVVPDKQNDRVEITAVGKTAPSVSVTYTDKDNKNTSVSLFNSSSDGKNGSALLRIKLDASKAEFDIKAVYSNVGTAKWLGKDIPVGTYTVSLDDPDKFISSLKRLTGVSGGDKPASYNEDMSNSFTKPMMMLDGGDLAEGIAGADSISPDELINELKNFRLTFGTTVTGDTCSSEFSLSLGELGSVSSSAVAVKSGDTYTAPDSSKEIDLKDDAAAEKLYSELGEWAESTMKRLGLDTMFGNIGGTPSDPETETRRMHYSAYDRYSSSGYASDCAEKIYNGLNDTVTKAVASGLDSGVIKLYYKNGELTVLDDAGVPGITYTDSGFDSVYAEVFFDNRVSDGIKGVSVILTDDWNDIPVTRPDIFCFVDGLFPWDDYSSEIGEYTGGTSPTLYYGEPITTQLPDKQRSVDELNEIAEDIAAAASKKLGSSGKLSASPDETDGELIFIIESDENGRWTAVSDDTDSAYGSFATGFADMVGTYIVSPDQSDLEAGVYFYNGKFVGTVVFGISADLEQSENNMPTALDFVNGSFFGWFALDENNYVPTAGYTQNDNGMTVHVGTYCTATKSELKYGDDPGSTESSGSISGTWEIIDQYGDFVVGDKGFGDAALAAVIETGDKIGSLILTADQIPYATYYITPSAYFEDEYDIYASPEDAENENDVKGMLWSEDDGTVTLCFVNDDKYTYYILAGGGSGASGGFGDAEFGAVKNDVELTEIVGRWGGSLNGEDMVLCISSNGILTVETNDGFELINPNDTGFDIFDADGNKQGSLQYSAETGTLKVIDDVNNVEVIFSKLEEAKKHNYMGKWVLYSVNGRTMQDIADKNKKKVEDITSYMEVSEYDIILSNAEGAQILLITAYDDAYIVNNPGDNLMETGTYNSDEETLMVTQTVTDDNGAVDESSASTILIFKRSL
ncbi:MAG: zinc-ribbon domain-containing protein [Ruminiclostridium sp.]|nr:zinc-ribbon domain-containing protein [Ruminiclostridium sp.]